MRLVCVEPDKPGFDLRTFECAKCSHDETVLIAIHLSGLHGPLYCASTEQGKSSLEFMMVMPQPRKRLRLTA
jgi:hypothetical protein